VAAWRVPWTTHARALAAGKHYRYRLCGGAAPAFAEAVAEASRGLPELAAPFPPEVMQVWQVVPELDLAAMRAAAAHLVGAHDFSSFRGGPPDRRPPVRRVHAIRLEEHDGAVVVDVMGEGFLRKMVRIVVGTLAEVGIGWRAPDDLPRLLAARDRRQSGPTAPARALWLEEVLLREEVRALLTEEARVTPGA
jgi:tRNA pseudouridine38-40 synthase